jgi:septal ring factor EnvC (AmiA/AmiB activator)
LKIEKLQTRIDKLKAVKQVGSLQYPLTCTAAFHVNVEQEQQESVILSNDEHAPTNCVVELETKLKNEAKEKQEALAKSDSLKKEVSRLDALLRKEAADSRARINEFREVEERNGVRELPRIFTPGH